MFAAFMMVFVYFTLGTVAGILGIPYSFLVGNVRLLYRIVIHGIVPLGVRAAGIRVHLTGQENIPPNTACIFLSNHVSNLDPPVLFPLIPGQASVMLKRELMRIPLLGTAMRLARFVPVDRGNRREAAQASVAAAAAVIRSGLHFIIFAEGTRSKDGRLAPFKSGPFYLAMETGAPIIPIAISGTQDMMRKGSAKIYPGTARVQMLSPIYPSGFATRDELMRTVRTAIANALPEDMKPLT
jgi:1-acyl-sn-glycerol-3-phosphate acyltransferase